MSKKVLIIGNGFDLDLGLNTRYSDFAKSEYWPKKDFYLENDLQKAMSEAAGKEAWFDLEQVLADYAAAQDGDTFTLPSSLSLLLRGHEILPNDDN